MIFLSQSGWRNEIGVEYRDKLAPRLRHTFRQRARLITGTVGSMQMMDVVPERGIVRDLVGRHFYRLIRGVVEHLDFEFAARYSSRQTASSRRSMTNCSSKIGS